MLPARTQLPNVILEDSEEGDDDDVPPMLAPPTNAFKRLSASMPVRKHTPFLPDGTFRSDASDASRSEDEARMMSLKKRMESFDEEITVSILRHLKMSILLLLD